MSEYKPSESGSETGSETGSESGSDSEPTPLVVMVVVSIQLVIVSLLLVCSQLFVKLISSAVL